jgi:peptidoglycan hydrolase-like protein with peptidoglycan-binding domain|tara:strand:+ start:19214 stop:20626 length:1413 start_codon:yes stop_codon:yes gene_type:complete
MRYRKIHCKALAIILIFSSSYIFPNEVQLITAHKKSNGTLLRIVTSDVMDIENIAGWSGQENWFYMTLNGASLSPSSVEYIEFEPPLMDIEVTENNESVQLGYLFGNPIEDFEIFHSNASRVILVQVWESLNDSLRSEVKLSEISNDNRVFSLPKQESKGSPFYDSFIYARDKYGPEKYFVWYNDWYSTQDIPIDSNIKEDPKPLIVKKLKVEISGPPLPEPVELNSGDVDVSSILEDGMLMAGIRRPVAVKELQKGLSALGYDLGSTGVFNNGVDGDFGTKTEDAIIQFQLDRGFSNANVDGIVGQGTYRELMKALSGEKPLVAVKQSKRVDMTNKFGSVIDQARQTARELLNQPPVTTQVKREIRRLPNAGEIDLLPPDLSLRKTFLKLSCNLEGANVFIDGSLIGQTPIPKKLAVKPGWHRVRVVDPNGPPVQFAMKIPDYQDIYIPKGRTQKIRINLAVADQESID